MRTTLNLDDDVVAAVKAIATQRGESIGSVASELIRRALRPDTELAYEMEVPVFAVREDAPPITAEMVEAAMEEL